jgi:hypothetical protein
VSQVFKLLDTTDRANHDDRVKIAAEVLARLGNHDVGRMQELMEDSATYQVEGTQGFSGLFEGREEIHRHLTQLVEWHDEFDLLEIEDWLVGDTSVACIAFAQAQGENQIHRSRELFLFGFWNGTLIGRFTVFFFDEGSSERFSRLDQ